MIFIKNMLNKNCKIEWNMNEQYVQLKLLLLYLYDNIPLRQELKRLEVPTCLHRENRTIQSAGEPTLLFGIYSSNRLRDINVLSGRLKQLRRPTSKDVNLLSWII